jgi:hypothetical protein
MSVPWREISNLDRVDREGLLRGDWAGSSRLVEFLWQQEQLVGKIFDDIAAKLSGATATGAGDLKQLGEPDPSTPLPCPLTRASLSPSRGAGGYRSVPAPGL